MYTKRITSVLIASAGLLMFSSANAAWVTCSTYAAANGIQPNGGCTVSDSATQDFLSTTPITVNADGGAFGHEDWNFIFKDDEEGGAATGLSGTYLVPANSYSEIMAIFKSGAGTFLTGYLLLDTSGNWTSPFQVNNTIKANSHISFYGRMGNFEVPEPTTLAMLGIGLLGFGLARRRRA